MSYMRALARALRYIEDHLNDCIDLSIVAKEAGYSTYHFHRIFKGIVGDPIKEYIRKRRITEAAKELAYTNKSIIDIGIKYGYQSRESFSRAFEKVYGRTPFQVKKEGLLYSIREPMTYDYMLFEFNRKTRGMKPVFEQIPERLVVGKKYIVKSDGSNYQDIPLLWNKWLKEKSWQQIQEKKYDSQSLGICIFSEEITFEYMIAYEVESIKHIPKNMFMHKLPKSQYAVFRTIGPLTESVQKTWDYIYTVWLNESQYKHAGSHDIERYFWSEGEIVADICIPIIKK
ncbi:AraC family transcriptional regulator [Clostridiaceae bacterium M8S5]|nr:AraC family transcriptional regulator [Clostridiaceae bacterium M8S5]